MKGKVEKYDPCNPGMPVMVVPTVKVRNYAPDGMSAEDPKSQNIVHWEGILGAGYTLKLQTWVKNNGLYMALRKNQNVGANIPISVLKPLLLALNDMQAERAALIAANLEPEAQ